MAKKPSRRKRSKEEERWPIPAPWIQEHRKFDWIEPTGEWKVGPETTRPEVEEMATALGVSEKTAWWIIVLYNEPSSLRLDSEGNAVATKDLGAWSYARGPKVEQLAAALKKSERLAWELLDDPLSRQALTEAWYEKEPEGYQSIVDTLEAIETLRRVVSRVPTPPPGGGEQPDADAVTCIARLLRREGATEKMFARALGLLRMKGQNSDQRWDNPDDHAPFCRDCWLRCSVWEDKVSPEERRDLAF